mgnify:CR=1 FL=1
MREDDEICADCGMDTSPCTGKRGCRHGGRWERYMVHRETGETGGVGDGYLCLGCIEARLGRCLMVDDLPDLPINWPSRWDSPRLLDVKVATIT